MKHLIFALLITTAFFSTSWADDRQPNNNVSCTYSAGDIGTITGYGSSIHKARSQASEMCFDKRADLYEAQRGVLSDDAGLDIIDSCVNIRCK